MGRAEPGGILAARYQLLAELRRDETGIVWLARDGLLHRDVAVKAVPLEPLPEEAGQEPLRQRVLRDARALAQLDHPNIPAVFGIVEDGGSTWMVLQAAPFRSPYRPLGDVVRNDGPLLPERAAEAGVQLLSALRAAHAVGVRHGDIRPGNVLLGPGNWAMLTGFGVVTAYDGRSAAGAPSRSSCYLAPERASGQPVTLAADLWSLGAILYAAVEGRPPFHGDGRAAVLAAVASGQPDRPSRAGPLWPVISGLLRKDPDARPDAAGADWLLRRVAGGRDAAGPVPPAEPAGPPPSAAPAPARPLEADREDAPAMTAAPPSTAVADDGATGDSHADSAADFIPGFGPRGPVPAGGAAADEDTPAETPFHDNGGGRRRWFAATVGPP